MRSEFGWAVIGVDTTGNGPRLRVFAPRNGRSVLLDPLEVESLTQWRHDELAGLVLGWEYAPGIGPPGDHDEAAAGDPGTVGTGDGTTAGDNAAGGGSETRGGDR